MKKRSTHSQSSPELIAKNPTVHCQATVKKTSVVKPSFSLSHEQKPDSLEFSRSENASGNRQSLASRLHLPILFPLLMLFSAVLSAVQAKNIDTIAVWKESFHWCQNAWNASKIAESPFTEQLFEENVYRSRRCVKMASSNKPGNIRLSLPAAETPVGQIMLAIRGARYEKSKPSEIIVRINGDTTLTDTLHFTSFYKDANNEPWRENDSMTQAEADFSSCDTAFWAVGTSKRFPYHTLTLTAQANDQCFLDQYEVYYLAKNDLACDLPYHLRTSAHYQNPNWLTLRWAESRECQETDRIVRIDSGLRFISENLHAAGEIAQYDLKYLKPSGRYQARVGRICPSGDTVFSEKHEFIFPEVSGPAVRFCPKSLQFEGRTGTSFLDTIYFSGENLEYDIKLQCRGNTERFFADPSTLDTEKLLNAEQAAVIHFTMERSSSPYNHFIEILHGPGGTLLDRIPVNVLNTDHLEPSLRVIRPGTAEIYPEGSVEFVFETDHFIPGKDGFIAIDLQDSTVYSTSLTYIPYVQQAGTYHPAFYLTDPDRHPLSEERIARVYFVEPGENPDPDAVCPVPEELFVDDITSTSAYLGWSSSADEFLLRIRTLFGMFREERTDISEFYLENLEPETWHLWEVAAVCAWGDTSEYVTGPDFLTERTVCNRNPDPMPFTIFPNPTTGNILISFPEDGKIEIIAPGGKTILSETVRLGEKNFRLDGKGLYLLRYSTANASVHTAKVMVR